MGFLFRFDRPRPNQDRMMHDIHRAVSDGRNMLINAPTGIGKTDAALSAALTYALKENLDVFFLTPKISQHKIVIEALQGITKRFDLDIRYADVVGKRNLCINTDVNSIDGESFYKRCEDVVKNRRCPFYFNAKDSGNITKEVIEAGRMGHNALFAESFNKGLCAYEVITQMAKDANVVIADYAHILNPYAKATFLRKISHSLGDAIVIWDEAHNVLDLASSYLSTTLSTQTIEHASKELEAINSNIDLGYLGFVMNEIAEKKLGLAQKTEAFIDDSDMPEAILKNAESLTAQLEKAGLEYITSSGSKRSSLMHISRFLTQLNSRGESMVSIISRREENIKISITCLYPQEAVESFKEAYANIFMSGTLLPLGVYKELLGIEEAFTANYASPFPKANKLCLVDSDVSTKYENRSIEEYEKIADKLGIIRMGTEGNIAIFFPSFDVMDSVYRYMQIGVSHMQRREMRSAALESLLNDFKNSSNSILFAVMGGSLSEGIDYANNVIKGIVIVGIPLDKPNLELNAKIAYMDRKFNNRGSEYAYLVPGVIRAVQAAGRAVRSERDRAFIVFMDRRYNWRLYRSIISNFLEISETKSYIGAIKGFFNKEKTLEKL